jgi:hypothetical protein
VISESAQRRTDPITDELRAIAELATVQDIAGAWAKFAGHYDGQVIPVAGYWQKWCTNEAKRERTERDKAANGTRRDGPADLADPYHSPAAVAERRRRNADYERAKREAAPAPVKDLLATVGGKAK